MEKLNKSKVKKTKKDKARCEVLRREKKEGYVYKFEGRLGEVIYIGRTNDIYRRMKEHFGGRGHKSKECYAEVTKVSYMKVKDMERAEGYLIRKYRPKYNKVMPKSTQVYVKENWVIYKILKEAEGLKVRKDIGALMYVVLMLYLIYVLVTTLIK